MEITIDLQTVRRVLKDEHAQAQADIERTDAVRAYALSQRRHDERLAAAPDASTLACRAGCSWCCHFTIDVRAVELIRILDVVAREFDPAAQAQLAERVRTNAEALRGLDDMARMQRNVQCPFLADGRCSIYAARPQTCRNYHATDATGCKQSFEQPDNLEIDPEFAPLTYQIGGAHVEAFCKALEEAGYDASVYEMNAALAAALYEPGFRERFAARAQPFERLRGEDAPIEFGD